MKIVLISPYEDLQAFGIRTLSACLKRAKHDVQLVFLPNRFTEKYEEQTLKELVEFSEGSDLIGISLMTNYFDNAVQITLALKDHTSIPILWGGIHPSVRPEESLNYADMVCIGEGEKAMVELAKRMNKGQNYYDVKNIWFKDKENLITNQPRPLIQDLNSIPFPDYDDTTHFILNKGHLQKMDVSLLNRHLKGIYMTMPTRGCPFACTYCCNNTLNKMYPHQKPLRKRSINNIIRELIEIKNQLPFIQQIKFDDDAFFLYPIEEIEEFCEHYKKMIDLPLIITGATPSTLTREKLSLLVDAGLKFIRMGIQTGSERTKRLYNRQHTNQQIEKAAHIIHEFKDMIIKTQYDIILDNPWENHEDLIATLMLLSKLPAPYTLGLFSLSFYPGTELYKKAQKDGLITDELPDVYRKNFNICGKSYLNKLFFLLNDYASNGIGISSKLMSLLTNQKMMQIKLHWLFYTLLYIGTIPWTILLKVKRFRYLLHESLQDIRQGDWSRIHKYMNRYIKNI